jgi:hypothetical protein
MPPLLAWGITERWLRTRDDSSRLHVHWFRWIGEDWFGTGSLYACRCGAARSSF